MIHANALSLNDSKDSSSYFKSGDWKKIGENYQYVFKCSIPLSFEQNYIGSSYFVALPNLHIIKGATLPAEMFGGSACFMK